MPSENREVLLDVKNLCVDFGSRRHPFHAVSDVSFQIFRGETFGLVGESGSGKTTIGRSIIRIHPTASGEVWFQGKRISGKISRELDREVTRKIQMIFQDPYSSLDPRKTCGKIVEEPMIIHKTVTDSAQRQERVRELMSVVGLDAQHVHRFPHEFSGGQRQRIGIARALILDPDFIVADEPISALDVSIRAQVLNLMSQLQRERGLTYLFIAHDLSVMRFICDRIAVIYKGRLQELAGAEQLFAHPFHPYTRALLSAIPQPNPVSEKQKKLVVYDPSCHGYDDSNPPLWEELEPGHFVRGSRRELDGYRAQL